MKKKRTAQCNFPWIPDTCSTACQKVIFGYTPTVGKWSIA